MEQILAGFKLMLAGMGAVFLFLTIMIVWVKLSACVCGRFSHLLPEKAVAAPAARGASGPAGSSSLIAAISAAVHRYRKEKQGLD